MIVFVALLLVAGQVLVFLAIDRAVSANTLVSVRGEIAVGERIFRRLLDERSQQLTAAARLLTSDFGFRQAIASGDQATMASALGNHGSRIGAAKMVLIGPDGQVMASAGASIGAEDAFPALVQAAMKSGSASAIALSDGRPHQLVVVPVLAPAPIGWVVVGFRIDAALAAELGQLTALDVSFASWQQGQGWTLSASNLPADAREHLQGLLDQTTPANAAYRLAAGAPDERVAAATLLVSGKDQAVLAVLQRSMAEALERFANLRTILIGLAALSLAATVVGSGMIANSISRPVTALVQFAQRLESGDYERGPPPGGNDELGQLATAFENMRLAVSAREQQIKAMAYHDALTGLPNRALFNDRLQQAVGVAQRLDNPVSVMLIDLDRFKEVNDTLGHHVGDQLLIEVAVRLRGVLARATDTAARLGGDEFAVLLPTADEATAREMAQRLRRAFTQPVFIEGRTLDVGGSIGIASFPRHGRDPHVLMSHADAAMYFAKRKRLPYAVYETRHATAMDGSEQLAMATELHLAVSSEQLVLHYQPRISLRQGTGLHAEALVRWQHPKRGFLAPQAFMPFAERTDCIHEVTRWVVGEAIGQAARWHAAGLPVQLSINLSVRDLLGPHLVGDRRLALQSHGASARWFMLEITESAIMDDPARALEVAGQLRQMGFQLSIDDFGSGYSSLSVIKTLPVAEIKIDRSFVAQVTSDRDDLAIVRSVIDLAHHLGLEVVAEGVESSAALALLKDLCCDHAQGYHVAMPMPLDEVETWLRARQTGRQGRPASGERTA
ncbi:MAG: EAL domain-containing protein [Rhodocyclaceae bacterium]|nr:EAL domain-containing protein [Rhodocyclaceae bacterium]